MSSSAVRNIERLMYCVMLKKVSHYRFVYPVHSNWKISLICVCLFPFAATAPQWARVSSFTRFLDHTQRRTTVSRTRLDEWSARRRDLYLTIQNTHDRQTDIHAPGGIRTHNLSRLAAADLRLRPRGHWDWHSENIHSAIRPAILQINILKAVKIILSS